MHPQAQDITSFAAWQQGTHTLQRVLCVVSPDFLQRAATLAVQIQATKAECQPPAIVRVSDAHTLAQALTQMGLFSQARVICAKLDPTQLKDAHTALLAHLQHGSNEQHCLLLCDKLDGRTATARALRAHKAIIEVPSPTGSALVQWLQARARRQGATLTRQAAYLLRDLVGNCLYANASALEQTLVYAKDQTCVEEHAVHNAVAALRQESMFNLAQAWHSGRYAEAMGLVQQTLTAGQHPLALLAFLHNQLARLLQAHGHLQQTPSLSENPQALAQALGTSFYMAQKILSLAEKLDVATASIRLERVQDVACALRTTALPAQQALECMLLTPDSPCE